MSAAVDAQGLLSGALSGFTASLSAREAVAEVEELIRLENMVQARLLQVLPQAEDGHAWEGCGYGRAKAWLADAGSMTTTEADHLLKLARGLETVEHEPINQALAAGAVSSGHAQKIVQRLATLPAKAGVELRGRVRDRMLTDARHLDPRALARHAKTILEVEAPDLAQDEEERQLARQEQRAGRRGLEILPGADKDGSARIRGWLPGTDAEVLRATLHRIAYPPNTPVDETDDRTHGQRLCDAFSEFLAGDRSDASRKNGVGTPKIARPARLMVTIGLDQLQTGDGVGHLDESGEPLPATTVRQLACSAGIIPVTLNGDGVPLDLGRERYLITAKLRQALEARDRGCIFPGCQTPLSRVDAHHVVHWADGGTTCLDNLVLLCRRHHMVIHHSNWEIRIGSGRVPEVLPPSERGTSQEPMPTNRQRWRRHGEHRSRTRTLTRDGRRGRRSAND